MALEPCHDPNDPRLEDFRDIRDRDLRGRQGIFIGEQPLVVEKMLDQPGLIRRILISETRRDWLERTLAERGHPDVPCSVVSRDIIETIVGFDLHRGVLASGNRAALDNRTLRDVIPPPGKPATILCCDSINNMDNIGMLFRTAAAFGVDAVLLDPTCHDPLYRKSLRVSIGHALTIPYIRSTDWTADLSALHKDHGVELLGASLGEGSTPAADIKPPSRVAIVMGSEYEGLRPDTIDACNRMVRIPMAPNIDSLNVAVAAAVLLDRFSRTARA